MTGILLIDKPAGITSFDAVAEARRLLNTKKIGHTGTLDPMATGVLPLLVGRATRAADILPRSDKMYLAGFKFGVATDTFDITGKVLERSDVKVEEQQIVELLPKYTGSIRQRPPMYSAVKVGGVRLYELARKGEEIETPEREVEVFSLSLIEFDFEEQAALFQIHCSKGTYIRSLCSDMGKDLGCGAALNFLLRTMASGFGIEDCITLERARELAREGRLYEALLPLDRAFGDLPEVFVTAGQGKRFINGGSLSCARLELPCEYGDFRVYSEDGGFLGIGAVDGASGELKVKKLFCEI